jgi:hypothetical protein
MSKYSVPSNILKQTSRCDHDYCCLETGTYMGPDGCEVDYLYGDNILFLKSKKEAPFCPYRASFSGRQMCLCPTKYNVFTQGQDADAVFSQCENCQEIWRNYHDFLSDQYVSLTGYQVSFKNLRAGQFIFNHSCGTTLGVPAGSFVHLYDGPIFEERATGSDDCPEYCLRADELGPCPVECECAYIREVLQIVRKWPKPAASFSEA